MVKISASPQELKPKTNKQKREGGEEEETD